MIQQGRIRLLNDAPVRSGRYVLYWMQQSQRLHWNHAFEYAISQANTRGEQVIVGFGITPHFPEANLRHYAFMFEGLEDVLAEAKRRGVSFVARVGSPDDVCVELAREASEVVVDCGYLRIQREWRRSAARRLQCRFTEVETDAIVPVFLASQKEEYAAATLRPRIHRLLPEFLVPIAEQAVNNRAENNPVIDSTTLSELREILRCLQVDTSVPPVTRWRGGTSQALLLLEDFLVRKLPSYANKRNDPTEDATSGLSAYLHFGQISPLHIAWRVMSSPPSPSRDAFLEELIVRRELSLNFATFNAYYDSFDCLPEWAKLTLERHASDRRLWVYTQEEFEAAKTHDTIWNTCQKMLVTQGWLHGYLRMYWGKKILEWSHSPQEAFNIALSLNNKYQLDGRDPNSFAGVAWCFGKHDRPWPERPIYGNVRCMMESGLQRKFDVKKYLSHVAKLLES